MLKFALAKPSSNDKKRPKPKHSLSLTPTSVGKFELQEKGIHVPSQTPKILVKLTAIIARYKPTQLVILGDVKYTVISSELGEWHDIPDFFAQLLRLVSDIAIVGVTMTPTLNRSCQKTFSFCLQQAR